MPHYDDATKAMAVEMYSSCGSVSKTADELGVSETAVRYWVNPAYRERQKKWSAAWIGENAEHCRSVKDEWHKKNPGYRDEYYRRNREACLRRSAEWAKANPDKCRVAHNKWARRNRAYVFRHFRSNPCVVCGERDVDVLCFHHRDPSEKEISISRLAGRGSSIERLITEIGKCDVLCNNCHAKLHRYLERELRKAMVARRRTALTNL